MPRGKTLIWIIAVAGLAIRVGAALAHPAWHDEYFTVWAIRGSWSSLIAALRLDSGPPLLYAVAKVVADIGVAPLVAARGVAVTAGALAVLFAAWATALRNRRAAWMAALLLAVHPLAVSWSAEGRAYGLLTLAVCVAWWALARLAADHHRGATPLAIAISLACWSHGLGLVLALASAAAALTLPRTVRRRALVGVAVGLASFLPWAPIMARQPAAAVAWMVDAWRAMPLAARALAPIRFIPPAASFNTAIDLPGAPLAAILGGAAICVLLAVYARPSRTVLALAAVPLASLWCAAALGLPVLYPGRGEALYLAPVIGILALGATRLRGGSVLIAALTIAALATDASAIRGWHRQPADRETVVAGEIRAALPGGGTVITSSYLWLDLWYALERTDPRYDVLGVPAAATAHPGWWVDGREPVSSAELDHVLERLSQPAGTCAVVVPEGSSVAPPLRALAQRLGLHPAARGLAVELWLPSGAQP